MSKPASDTKQIEAFRSFKLTRVLNEGTCYQPTMFTYDPLIFSSPDICKWPALDTGTKSMCLLGSIGSQDAIIVAEKTAFNTSPELLERFQEPSNLSALKVLGQNDIYHWFLASHSEPDNERRPEIKFTFIYPATETHIKKYSRQSLRMVTETPQVYRELVKPYVESRRSNGRLTWVYNILAHQTEEKFIFEDTDEHEGFILLPDMYVQVGYYCLLRLVTD